MKVEIELEYIEGLKSENEQLREMNRELESHLSSINEIELVEKAKRLSMSLTHKAIGKIMAGLGFNDMDALRIRCGSGGNIWDDYYNWEVEIGASIIGEFKRGYVSMGIIPPSELETAKITLEGE